MPRHQPFTHLPCVISASLCSVVSENSLCGQTPELFMEQALLLVLPCCAQVTALLAIVEDLLAMKALREIFTIETVIASIIA